MNKRRSLFPVMVKTGILTTDTSATDLCKEFEIPEGSRIRVDVLISAKPSSGTITLTLLTGTLLNPSTGARLYETAKTFSLTSSTPSSVPGFVSITLNPEVSGDQGVLPLGMFGIVRAASDGTATATAPSIVVVQER